MKNAPLNAQQIEAVIAAFEKALSHDFWQRSAFLRVIWKKLDALYQTFVKEVEQKKEKERAQQEEIIKAKKLGDTQIEVYVLLYSMDSKNIHAWEHILVNLPRQVVSRPIYENLHDIERAISDKKNANNHAYAVVYTNPSDILQLPEDKRPKDNRNTPLIMLKDKSLTIGHVVRFVHHGKTYEYTRGRLVELTS